jgi:beta-lactam-binding protein with PASTA domain
METQRASILGAALAAAALVGCGSDSRVRVPDVIGDTSRQARQEIQAAGLDAKIHAEPRYDFSGSSAPDFSPFVVKTQSPDGGVRVDAGSVVKATAK